MSWITKRSLALACGVLLVACAREEASEEQPTDAFEEEPAAATPATVSLADVAGTWNMQAMTEAGDSVPAYELVATEDMSGWVMHFPDREPISMRVLAVAGDSVVTEAGPYESVLRPGVQVTTQTVFRVQDGRLMGSTVARYQTSEADSVVRVEGEGTRAP